MTAPPFLFSMAHTTLSPSWFWAVCVSLIKWVSVLAVCLPRGDHRWAVAAPRVFAWRNWFNMSWIHATARTAKMVGLKPRREGAD